MQANNFGDEISFDILACLVLLTLRSERVHAVLPFSPLWLSKAAELVILFFEYRLPSGVQIVILERRKMCAAHWDRMRSCYSKPY